jgi:hypothetical protein
MLLVLSEPAWVLVMGAAVVAVVRGEGEGRTIAPLPTFTPTPSSIPTTPLTLFRGEGLAPVNIPILFVARPLGLALSPPIVPDCTGRLLTLLLRGARGEEGERACIAWAACKGMRRLLLGDVMTLRITRWIPPTARDRAAVVVAMERTV